MKIGVDEHIYSINWCGAVLSDAGEPKVNIREQLRTIIVPHDTRGDCRLYKDF